MAGRRVLGQRTGVVEADAAPEGPDGTASQTGVASGLFRRPGPDESVSQIVHRYGFSAVARVLGRMSVVKTLYCSLRFRAPIVIGRRTKLVLPRGARIRVRRGGAFLIGIDQNHPRTSLLEIASGGLLSCDGIVSVCRGAKMVIGSAGSLSIGGGTYFNDGCTVMAFDHSSFGSGCAIAWNVTIVDTDMHRVVRDGEVSSPQRGYHIDNDVWIGAHAIILKGVTIGSRSVVAAGAVLSQDLPIGSLAAGNPARIVDHDVTWLH